MGRLSKEQKRDLNDAVSKRELFAKINTLLNKNGAGDLRVISFKVQAIKLPQGGTANSVITQNNNEPNFNVFPPLCQHGIKMIERCTVGGNCTWVCNHN